mgnify:CR=1 FL=1
MNFKYDSHFWSKTVASNWILHGLVVEKSNLITKPCRNQMKENLSIGEKIMSLCAGHEMKKENMTTEFSSNHSDVLKEIRNSFLVKTYCEHLICRYPTVFWLGGWIPITLDSIQLVDF